MMDWIALHIFGNDVLLKLCLAALLSLVIGVERELKKKPVGLKTSLVIATFSCLLTIISIETAYTAEGRDDINITMDPLRLAAQIVSGIGFLGAGVILRRGNDSITGLTTAAMIWGAAGIGIGIGAGFYLEATIAVLVVLIGIEVFPPFLAKVGPKRLRMNEISIRVKISDADGIQLFMNYLEENKMEIENLRVRNRELNTEPLHELDFRLVGIKKKNTAEIYKDLLELSYIKSCEVEILS
ncbi:MgtC/SapB family protein [Chungangia koreensis]|uniref:MgtC/SapB family protein n=1 Tax=Chungangia koreensis TaxID=752657 RepID=A0ABV8X7D4_9LACT